MGSENKDFEKRTQHQELAEQILDGKLRLRWVTEYRCPNDRRLLGGLVIMPDGERALYNTPGSRQDTQVVVGRQSRIVDRLDQWIETGKPPEGEWPARVERTVDGERVTVEPNRYQLGLARADAARELEEAKAGTLTEPPGLRFIRWETGDRSVRTGVVELPCPRCHAFVQVEIQADGKAVER